MKVRNILSGLGLICALSPAVARADAWDDFRTKASELGYSVMEVPLRESGVPRYGLWNIAEAVRVKDYDLNDGYPREARVTLCDPLTTRNEVVGINNRISDASAEVADAVGLRDYAVALRSDTELVRMEAGVCSDVVVDTGRDGIRGDRFRTFSGDKTKGYVLVAVEPEDMPSRECTPDVDVIPEVPTTTSPAVETPVIPSVVEPKLEFLPRGRNQWDLGYRRLGMITGVSGRNFIVEHLSNGKVNTTDGESDLYLQPRITLPIIGNDNWNLFADYDGRFSFITGDIGGSEQDSFVAGGLQYSGERFGLGAEVGGILYERITGEKNDDTGLVTTQFGNGLGARVLFRAPGAIVGYNFDRVPLDVLVEGSLEGYGNLRANANADVAQHELYGGPLLGGEVLQVLPYVSLRATSVAIQGDGNVPDQRNTQQRFGVGVDGRINVEDHWTLNLGGSYALFEDINSEVNGMQIETGHGSYDIGVGVTVRP